MNKKVSFIAAIIIIFSAFLVGCGTKGNEINPTLDIDAYDDQATLTQTVADNTPISEESQNIKKKQPIMIIRTINRGDGKDKVFLVDDEFEEIDSFSDTFQYLALSTDNCSLVAVENLNNMVVVEVINYQGEIVDQKEIRLLDSDNSATYQYLISPKKDWVAYLRVSGEWGMSFETAKNQNVELLKINETKPQTPIRLTENGGASSDSFSWSPKGDFLAFTDFDSNGIRQIYLFDFKNNQKTKISRFAQNYVIDQIRWSPDSSKIAFSFFIMKDDLPEKGRVGLFLLQDNKITNILEDNISSGMMNLWWGKEDHLLILHEDIAGEVDHLWWYGPDEDKVIRDIDSEELSLKTGINNIYRAFPVTDDLNLIAVFGYPTLFNVSNSSVLEINQQSNNDIFHGEYQVILTPSKTFTPRCLY